ncbi:MAG: hypothetical protein KJO43_16000, partial [Phycisphaerae bacterium]|nr:hypothetical protein [Phycisphaerae bacterium]
MRIDGSIPFHAARAYGMPRTPSVRPVTAPTPVAAPTHTTNAPTSATSKIDALVGGRVSVSPIENVSMTPMPTVANAYQMYT